MKHRYTTKNVKKKKRKSYLKKKIKEEEELSISRRKDSKNVQTFLERVFACYDVDGDGHIDRDELKKWYVAVENWIQKTKYQKEDQKLRSTFLNVNVDVDDIEHSISFEKGPIGLKLIHQNDGNHVHHIETDSQADSHSDILQNGYRLIRINEMDVPRGMSMEHAMDILGRQPRPVTLTFKPPDRIHELAYAIDANNTDIIQFPHFSEWFHRGDDGESSKKKSKKDKEKEKKEKNKVSKSDAGAM